MKTTLELPADLMRAIKIRAVEDDRKLKDLVAELLERGLGRETRASARPGGRRVRLPLVRCAHTARPGAEITPERAAQILLEEERRAGSRVVR